MRETDGNKTHPKILLAEDDRAFRELLAFSLYRAGYSVTSCDNGLKLLELLEPADREAGEEFDLVLTDLRMPALTGLEVLEALHDLPKRPPFICMTAFGDPETHETARRLGAAGTIDKPFDIDRAISLIRHFCPQGQRLPFQSRRTS